MGFAAAHAANMVVVPGQVVIGQHFSTNQRRFPRSQPNVRMGLVLCAGVSK